MDTPTKEQLMNFIQWFAGDETMSDERTKELEAIVDIYLASPQTKLAICYPAGVAKNTDYSAKVVNLKNVKVVHIKDGSKIYGPPYPPRFWMDELLLFYKPRNTNSEGANFLDEKIKNQAYTEENGHYLSTGGQYQHTSTILIHKPGNAF